MKFSSKEAESAYNKEMKKKLFIGLGVTLLVAGVIYFMFLKKK